MIHQYQSKGYNIVLDVNSGSVHVVDDLGYELIGKIEKDVEAGLSSDAILQKYTQEQYITSAGVTCAPQEIKETVEEILELKEQGMLYAKDIYEPYIDQFMNRETVVKAMCLHIAHDCNLACKYCFAGEGEYHGDRGLMSFEVGKKALDFLIQNSGNRVNLEVDFFGGEPLLNWDVVKQLVQYGREMEKIHNKNSDLH